MEEYDDEFENEFEEDNTKIIENFKIDNDTKINVSQLLQKINRILGEDETIVNKDGGAGGSIGATDIKSSIIYLDYDQINKITKEDLAKFLTLTKGINYHELAHILFTNISRDKIEKYFMDKARQNVNKNVWHGDINDYFNTFNLLEDCRIENLFSTEYDRAKYYFSFAAISVLMKGRRINNEEYQLGNYLLLYGRKFLNVNLSKYRNTIKVDDKIITKTEKIVDTFIIETDLDKRLQLTYDLMQLLIDNRQNIDRNTLSSVASLNTSRKTGKGQKISDTTEQLKEKLKEQKEEEEGDDVEGEEKEDKKDNKNKKSSKNKDMEEEEDEEEEDEDEDEDEENDLDKNTKKLTDKIKETFDKAKTEKQILDKIMDIVENELVHIESEINKDMNTLRAVAGKSEFSDYDGEIFKPTEVEKFEAKKVENVLKILRSDLSTHIHKFRKSGKFDIQSAIKSEKNNNLNAFAKHELNKIDKSRLGISILLDSSASVGDDDFKKEISASWCLSEAFKNTNNKVQVVEFSDLSNISKNFNSEGDWQRHYRGGTEILKPLIKVTTDLMTLKRNENINNLLTIIISDGYVSDLDGTLKHIDKMKQLGITTVFIFVAMGERIPELFSKKVDLFIHLKDFKLLSFEIKKLVIKLQKDINRKLINNTFYNYSIGGSSK